MKKTLFCFVALLLAPISPEGLWGAGGGPGLLGKKSEFIVKSPEGRFKIVVDPGARKRIAEIHGARRVTFQKKGDMERIHKKMRQKDILSSNYIDVSKTGILIGVFMEGDEFQLYTVWDFDLNEDGNTARVVFSGGTLSTGRPFIEKPAVIVKVYDSKRKELRRYILTDFAAIMESEDR